MKTQIQEARKAGYSDEEIGNFLSQKEDDTSARYKKAVESGYSPKEVLDYLHDSQQPSRARSLASAAPKGLIKGAQNVSPIPSFGPVPRKLGERLTEQFLPTQEKGPEKVIEQAAELAPIVAVGPGTVGSKALQLAGGTLLGHLAKENETGPLGQAVSEAIGMTLPGALKSTAGAITKAVRAPAEKFASGLTKPAAVEAKMASKGIITPTRQKEAIAKLNEEAATLSKGVIEKELPIAEKIQAGHDFEKEYQTRFEKLKRHAEHANPEINITPVTELINKTASKYRGIPRLHPEARNVVKEIKAFSNRPQTELKNLLKIYRSNNQKLKNIYETSRLTGRQQEYADFLVDMNKSIGKSFEQTLPADSLWLKEFKKMNASYREFKNATKTLATLEPILGQKLTPASLEKLATDKKTLDKLSLSLGEKGAQDISSIAKDLKEAIGSLKKMKASEIKAWDTIVPFSLFIPHTHGVGKALTAKKGLDFVRRGYGYYLSSPAKRRELKEVYKAINNHDKSGYIKATTRLNETEKD